MSEAELISLFVEISQALDSNFEFWLTISFALVVASYLVTERVPLAIVVVTIFLYIVATVLFMLRGATMGKMLSSIRDQFDAMNTDTFVLSAYENYSVAVLYFVTMVAGSLMTIAFVYWRFHRLRSQADA